MTAKKFLEKLQTAEETTKRRWLVIFSFLAIVIVVFFWLIYFNTLTRLPPETAAKQADNRGFSLGQTVKGTVVALYRGAANVWYIFGQKVAAPRNYEVAPAQ